MISHYRHSLINKGEIKNDSEDLRQFFDKYCYTLARCAERGLYSHPEDDGHIMADKNLVLAMPVKFICLGDAVFKKSPLPPIMAEALGEDALRVDAEYSLIGSYLDWLFHISYTQYDWIADIEISQCRIIDNMGIVIYDNGTGEFDYYDE